MPPSPAIEQEAGAGAGAQAQDPAQPAQAQHQAPLPPAFDWAGAIHGANMKARRNGLRQLPSSRVGRVFENGKLIDLVHHRRHGLQSFICFDGFAFMARVRDLGLINFLLYDMAAFYIGKKANSAHPRDIDLSVEVEIIKVDDEFIGWAVLIQPKALSQNNQ